MDYQTIDIARAEPGLRLVLNAGVPGPWSEAAKALFHHHNVAFVPVAQVAGGANEDLVDWTGHRNAPIAIYEQEPPRTRWIELLDLAERLGTGPSLLPKDRAERVEVIGWVNEIAGEGGFGWSCRHLIFDVWAERAGDNLRDANPMLQAYRFDPTLQGRMLDTAKSFLKDLGQTLKAGTGEYLVGETFSVADLYWAYFSNLLAPLPDEMNPMAASSRSSYEIPGMLLSGFDASVLNHRDLMFQRHLLTPLKF
ncbi:MAG: hypothetical protein ACPHAN_07060 [Pseudomonadales bacterium]